MEILLPSLYPAISIRERELSKTKSVDEKNINSKTKIFSPNQYIIKKSRLSISDSKKFQLLNLPPDPLYNVDKDDESIQTRSN